MKITSVQNFNQNIRFGQNRQAYYLYSLVEHYDKLSPVQKKLLKENNFNKERLQILEQGLSELNRAIKIDNIGGHEILLRHDSFMFEIGTTCKLLLQAFFRGIKLHDKNLEWTTGDISKESVNLELSKIINEYNELKNNMEGGTEEDFYKSKTLEKLYSPEYKVKPKKTKNGYLTTIINNETGAPENAYIRIRNSRHTPSTSMFLEKANDFSKYPRVDILGYTDDKPEETSIIGVLDFDRENEGFTNAYIYPKGGTHILEEYSGVGYRLVQALIEYALQNNAKNIVVTAIPEYLHFYSKAGFRVNPENDKIIFSDYLLENMLKEGERYGLPKEQFISALTKRTKDGITGYGKYETFEILNKLLYLKNKYLFYPGVHIPLELTPQAKEEWLERIKLQPILGTIRK